MTYYDKIFPAAAMLFFLILQTMHHRDRFRHHEKVNHTVQGVIYAATAVFVCLPLLIFYGFWVFIKLGFILFMERLAVYDPLLNTFRIPRKPLFYNDDAEAESWQDRLENMLPKRWIIPLKIGYIVVFVVCIIFIK